MSTDDRIPLEVLEIEQMASGDRSLRLTARVTWEDFPDYASAIVRQLGGSIVERADTPVERVWSSQIRGELFWISFDDFALGVSLDSQSRSASRLIPDIRKTLLMLRGDEGAG